ncbi:MAG: Gfo/Idh/MocA family oxidoreductase [Candidatus Dormibacteraeota bacterium]|nr:Gfo/Idh/MocA family oxidoreductase [Candidatus Dormibacteraeota bacterium]
MSEGEVGVAIQGTGSVSTEHIRAYLRDPRARIVALGSRTREGAQRKAREMGLDVPVFDRFEELLARPDVDAVSICTPHERHSMETVLAAEAGKHVLIEKPVALDVDQLGRMRDAVRAAGVRTVVSFVLRWNPAVSNIKALKQDGALGTTFHVQTDYWHNPGVARHMRGLAERGGGSGIGGMLTGGCHAMDAARYLMESDIVEVSARSWDPPSQAGSGGPAENTVALVRFANGAMGKVSGCISMWMPYAFNIDLLGTDGSVRGDRFFTRKLPGLTGMGRLPTVLPDSGDVAHHPFGGEISHFIDCILSGHESHVNLEDAVNTHEACFAADMSAAQGGATIKLPLL